jgi:hypothetical protein
MPAGLDMESYTFLGPVKRRAGAARRWPALRAISSHAGWPAAPGHRHWMEPRPVMKP